MMKIIHQVSSHKKAFLQIFIILIYLFAGIANASNSVKFYLSNSTNQSDQAQALSRLFGPEQYALQNSVIDSLQTKHMQQTRLHFAVGTYKNLKRDVGIGNTLVMITSPYQELSEREIVSFASALAKKFKQETVGVFIPDAKSKDLDVVLTFPKNAYVISELLQILRKNLPSSYAEGVTLYLNRNCKTAIRRSVFKVEWLGSNLDTAKLRKVFPQANMHKVTGRSIFVDQLGNITSI